MPAVALSLWLPALGLGLLPPWPPTYKMSESSVVQPCNYSCAALRHMHAARANRLPAPADSSMRRTVDLHAR